VAEKKVTPQTSDKKGRSWRFLRGRLHREAQLPHRRQHSASVLVTRYLAVNCAATVPTAAGKRTGQEHVMREFDVVIIRRIQHPVKHKVEMIQVPHSRAVASRCQ
jgi:hypothetical protein